jgi:hypothetical protein
MGLELDEAFINRPTNHRFLQEAVGHAREQGKKINADGHGKKALR